MPDAVVDASALAAVAFGEPEGPEVAKRLAGVTLRARALLWFELANVCLTKIRRRPDDADRLRNALREATQLSIHIHDVDPVAAVAVAEEAGLSAYDASYVWLARHLHAELVTLDGRLHAAAHPDAHQG